MTNLDQNEETPRDRILNVARDLGLSMTSEFVPFSHSRNKAEKHPSLNWIVTLLIGHGKVEGGRAILTTDYMAGSGHCPSYKQQHFGTGSYLQNEAVKWECEYGKPARVLANTNIAALLGSKPLQPDMADVLYSLVSDADVLDISSFEEWASDLGYDTDSRQAEKTYRACLDIALKLRNGLSEEGLRRLREACQGY